MAATQNSADTAASTPSDPDATFTRREIAGILNYLAHNRHITWDAARVAIDTLNKSESYSEHHAKRPIEQLKYSERCQILSLGVFEDLNRPTPDELGALCSQVGHRASDFESRSDNPARRADAHILRAANSARQAKRESPDYGTPPSPVPADRP